MIYKLVSIFSTILLDFFIRFVFLTIYKNSDIF